MGNGFFFDPNEIAGKIIIHNPMDENSCTYCGMFRGVKSPMIKPYGEGKKKIMIVGEAPGANEDDTGIPFIGESGERLKEAFGLYGVDLDRDCIRTNVLQCRPKNNEFDETKVEFCYHRLERQIQEFNPYLIFAFGQRAAKRLIETENIQIPGLSGKAEGFKTIHGDVYPIRRYNAWVSLNYHPAFIMRNPDMSDVFFDDIERGLKYLDYEFPVSILDTTKRIYCDKELALSILNKKYDTYVSMDYETTGLHPYAKGFELLLMSVCFDGEVGYVIPLYPKDEDIFKSVAWFLRNNPINCHKYDDSCTRAVFGFGITNWVWDIMISKHILDERRKKKSLEFLTFETTGEEYKQTVNKDDFKKELVENFDQAVNYSGLDAIFPYHIQIIHNEEIQELGYSDGMKFLMDGSKALAELEENGVKIDMEEYNRFRNEVADKSKEVNTFFAEDATWGSFKKRYGEVPNVSSNLDMQRLLFDMLKLKPLSTTDKGQPQVNDALFEVLEQREDYIGELVKNIQIKKSLGKLTNTYLDSIPKYIGEDGKLHAIYNLHIARTLRSSCDSPNLQNAPKRDEYMKNFRRMFVPEFDLFMEADYKGAEVTVQAILAQDRNLLQQINEHFNSHRFWASRLFQVPESAVTKLQRFLAKNKFVFPEFYGASARSCAPQLGLPEKHVVSVEEEFYTMYSGVKKWQEHQWKFYLENGYVEIPTGFRRRGPLTYMQVVNTPIQGTTFHCLLDSLIRVFVNKALEKEGLKSRVVLQIHDSMVLDTVKAEREDAQEVINNISRDKYRWNFYKGAELEVEWQEGPNWLDMKEVA